MNDVKSSSTIAAPPISELMHLLERMVLLYQNLCNLLQEEYSHMSVLDVSGLLETAHAKETILNQIWELEQKRISVSEVVSDLLSLPEKPATVSALANRLQKIDGDRLLKLSEILTLSIVNARDLNIKNMDFANGSLQRINLLKNNVLGISSQSSRENYSNNGQRQPTNEQGGRLLSTEA